MTLKDISQYVKKMRSWFSLSNFQKLSETQTAKEKVLPIRERNTARNFEEDNENSIWKDFHIIFKSFSPIKSQVKYH